MELFDGGPHKCKSRLVWMFLVFSLLGAALTTMDAYILQTFHILQNFKGCHKTNCIGRFWHKLVITSCSEVSYLWQPYFGKKEKWEKSCIATKHWPITKQIQFHTVLWLVICRIWKSCKIYSMIVAQIQKYVAPLQDFCWHIDYKTFVSHQVEVEKN